MNQMNHDTGVGTDQINAAVLQSLLDHGSHKTVWKIEKFANDDAVKAGKAYETVEFGAVKGDPDFDSGKDPLGNGLANAGINLMLTKLAGGAGTVFDNSNAYLGVGDS